MSSLQEKSTLYMEDSRDRALQGGILTLEKKPYANTV